jgi:hypothetical protein
MPPVPIPIESDSESDDDAGGPAPGRGPAPGPFVFVPEPFQDPTMGAPSAKRAKTVQIPTYQKLQSTVQTLDNIWETTGFDVFNITLTDGTRMTVKPIACDTTAVDGHGHFVRALEEDLETTNRIVTSRVVEPEWDALTALITRAKAKGFPASSWVNADIMVASGDEEKRINKSITHPMADDFVLNQAWLAAASIGARLKIPSPLRTFGYTAVDPDSGVQRFHRDTPEDGTYWTVAVGLTDSPDAGTRLILPPTKTRFYDLSRMIFPWPTGEPRDEEMTTEHKIEPKNLELCEFCLNIFPGAESRNQHRLYCHSNPTVYDAETRAPITKPTFAARHAWMETRNEVQFPNDVKAPRNKPTDQLGLAITRGDNPVRVKVYINHAWADATVLTTSKSQTEGNKIMELPVVMEYADSCPEFTQGCGTETITNLGTVNVLQTQLDSHATMVRHLQRQKDIIGWDGNICHAGSRNAGMEKREIIMLTFHSGVDTAQPDKAVAKLNL